MLTLNFTIAKTSSKTINGPITQVQLSGTTPLTGTSIKTLTITRNDQDKTEGTLVKASPIGSIKASPTRFDQLCSAIKGVNQGTLIVVVDDEFADPMIVNDISCQTAAPSTSVQVTP